MASVYTINPQMAGFLPGLMVTVAGLFNPSPTGGFLLVSGYTKTLADRLRPVFFMGDWKNISNDG